MIIFACVRDGLMLIQNDCYFILNTSIAHSPPPFLPPTPIGWNASMFQDSRANRKHRNLVYVVALFELASSLYIIRTVEMDALPYIYIYIAIHHSLIGRGQATATIIWVIFSPPVGAIVICAASLIIATSCWHVRLILFIITERAVLTEWYSFGFDLKRTRRNTSYKNDTTSTLILKRFVVWDFHWKK